MTPVEVCSAAEPVAALQPIIQGEAEPDVTWGLGGIDDWGWTAQREAQARAETEAAP